MLYEDKSFKNNNLSALVASKVYYHLEAYEQSLTYALGADDMFDVNASSEYVERIIGEYKLSERFVLIFFCSVIDKAVEFKSTTDTFF